MCPENDQRYYYEIISMLYWYLPRMELQIIQIKINYLFAFHMFFSHCYFWTVRVPVGNELVKNVKAVKWKIQQSTKLPIFNFSGYNGKWLN